MTSSERLAIVKKNLQRINTANDDFILHLMEQAGRRLGIMGIDDDGTGDYEDALIDYTCYLFRKRDKDESDSGMPVFLRREIHDLRLHQEAVEAAEEA